MNQTQKRFIQTRHELHQHPELSNQETATAGRNLNLFESFKPDFAFALHNMPGVPLGQVQCKTGPFACASRGMIIRLKGKPSHAAYPEDGISPAKAMCRV